MDIILSFLAKPADRHRNTPVHITYPPLRPSTDRNFIREFHQIQLRVGLTIGKKLWWKMRLLVIPFEFIEWSLQAISANISGQWEGLGGCHPPLKILELPE